MTISNVKTSTFLGINWRDALLSALTLAVTAGIGTASGSLYSWFHSASFSVNTEQLILACKAGAWAGLADIGRRVFSANKIVLTSVSKEQVEAVKEGSAKVTIINK